MISMNDSVSDSASMFIGQIKNVVWERPHVTIVFNDDKTETVEQDCRVFVVREGAVVQYRAYELVSGDKVIEISPPAIKDIPLF